MIYIFIAPGFEEIEALATLDILRRAELEVQSVGVGGKTITGSHGIPVVCDITEAEVSADELEMVILPGGMPGTLNLEKSPVVQKYIDFVLKQDLWLAAICAAPSILGHKGVLEGKRVTCFPGYDTQLGNARYTGDAVVQDGKLVTGKGPGAAIPFALKLVECLISKERADLLGAALQ